MRFLLKQRKFVDIPSIVLINNLAAQISEAKDKCIHSHWQFAAFGIALFEKVNIYVINEIQVSMALTYFS